MASHSKGTFCSGDSPHPCGKTHPIENAYSFSVSACRVRYLGYRPPAARARCVYGAHPPQQVVPASSSRDPICVNRSRFSRLGINDGTKQYPSRLSTGERYIIYKTTSCRPMRISAYTCQSWSNYLYPKPKSKQLKFTKINFPKQIFMYSRSPLKSFKESSLYFTITLGCIMRKTLNISEYPNQGET